MASSSKLDFSLAEETLGYQTNSDVSNTDKRLLAAGSQNTLVDVQLGVRSRPGYTRLGVANPALAGITNGWTWITSLGQQWMQRFNQTLGILEVYIGTVDGTVINTWTTIRGNFSATAKLRPALTEGNRGGGWYDQTETLDVQLMVQGDDNVYDWSGGVAVVAAVSNATGIIATIGTSPNEADVLSSGGSGYQVGDILTITGGDGTATLMVDQIMQGGIGSLGIITGGTGYAPGDFFLINGGVGVVGAGDFRARGKVLTVDGSGAVLTMQLYVAGAGYSTSGYGTTHTSGAGTGLIINALTVGNTIAAWHLVKSGTGYSSANDVATTGGSGTGAAVKILSVEANSITKVGPTTWAQNHFYATRNTVLVCVRTGVEYTYAHGVGSLTLTGISVDPTGGGLIAGDILIQKVVVAAVTPTKGRVNTHIVIFQNQVMLGSSADSQVYISHNTNYTDYTFTAGGRLPGEGGLLTMDSPTRALASLGNYFLAFAGNSSIFRAEYKQQSVSTTLVETLTVLKFDVGVDQGALGQESMIPLGNQLVYLTNEVAVRSIDNVQNLTGINPKRLSTPIKPDFDGETWSPDAFGMFYKNILFFVAATTGHMYMLNYLENADGKLVRFWNPPQILPIGAMSIADLGGGPRLYGHSYSVPETYLLFDGLSDGQYDNMDPADKIAIHAIATYAYDTAGHRELLKNFDEYAVDGEINPNTRDLEMDLNYDFQGATQQTSNFIDGTDESILQGMVDNNSVAQALLGGEPLGGLLVPPSDARRFHVIFEMAREDYFELNTTFSTNDVDRYWKILAHGPNQVLSRRKPINTKK